MTELRLRELEVRDQDQFRAAARAFGKSDPDWDFAFEFDEDTDFPAYVAWLRDGRRGEGLPAGWVAHTFLVAEVGDRIVGRVSVRHQLTDFLREYGGHIGFGVLAQYRRRGYATEILRQTMPWARALGIDRVLVTCDQDNLGSRTVIERCGGVLEDTRCRLDGGVTRRYWIDLSG